MNNKGFSLVELMVVIGLLTFLFASGSVVINTSQSAWATTDANIQLQEDLRTTLHKMSKEIGETGEDASSTLQLELFDGTGVGGSDIVRFSIPICVCGSVMDANGDVRNWGAPMQWGQTGCSREYTLNGSSEVDICWLDPNDPSNTADMSVPEADLNDHLANGSIIGSCGTCSVATNSFIEYRLDANGRMLRRVLSDTLGTTKDDVFAENVDNFQISINGDNTVITMNLDMQVDSTQNRTVTLTETLDVYLRNVR